MDGKLLIVFNARNEHDRFKFAEDLRESICEMDEMENLRIEAELERQKSNRGNRTGINILFIKKFRVINVNAVILQEQKIATVA